MCKKKEWIDRHINEMNKLQEFEYQFGAFW